MAEIEQLTLVTHKEFNNLLKADAKNGDGIILLTFVSRWAGPCNLFDKTLEQAESKRWEKILFVYCDIDEEKELARQFDCRAVPSFVLFKAGDVVAAGAGHIKVKDLLSWIDDRLTMYALAAKLALTKKKK